MLHFGSSAAVSLSTAASHPIFAMLLFPPMTRDSIWLLEEVFSGESKANERLAWVPGNAAAQKSDSGNTGSWPETKARLWARRSYAGTTALAVCSAGAGSPSCLRKLPWKTKGTYFGDNTARPGQLLQCVLLVQMWVAAGAAQQCSGRKTTRCDGDLCYTAWP